MGQTDRELNRQQMFKKLMTLKNLWLKSFSCFPKLKKTHLIPNPDLQPEVSFLPKPNLRFNLNIFLKPDLILNSKSNPLPLP